MKRRWKHLVFALLSGLILASCALGGQGPSGGTSSVPPTGTALKCTTGQLKVELGRAGAAAGHIGQEVRFKNISSTTCTLKGYPRLQLIGAAGQLLATHINDGTDYTVRAMPVKVVTLAKNAYAAFLIGYADATGYGTAICPASHSVKIYPPALNQPLSVTWRLQPYGGATIAQLQCGDITVSPVVRPSQLIF